MYVHQQKCLRKARCPEHTSPSWSSWSSSHPVPILADPLSLQCPFDQWLPRVSEGYELWGMIIFIAWCLWCSWFHSFFSYACICCYYVHLFESIFYIFILKTAIRLSRSIWNCTSTVVLLLDIFDAKPKGDQTRSDRWRRWLGRWTTQSRTHRGRSSL